MQFIDQAAAYNQKSISLDQAVAANRAKLTSVPDGEKLAQCFRPELKIAIAFDLDIEERLNFNALSTPAKLDLLIEDLLPKFFHPDLLPLTGRDAWYVQFVVDGSVRRMLRMDDLGLHDVSGDDHTPDIEIETDVMTLLAMLRSAIAQFHITKPPYPTLPNGAGDDDDEVWGN